MANVTLPTFYFNTANIVEMNTSVNVINPTITAIFARPIESTSTGITPTSVVVTNPSK